MFSFLLKTCTNCDSLEDAICAIDAVLAQYGKNAWQNTAFMTIKPTPHMKMRQLLYYREILNNLRWNQDMYCPYYFPTIVSRVKALTGGEFTIARRMKIPNYTTTTSTTSTSTSSTTSTSTSTSTSTTTSTSTSTTSTTSTSTSTSTTTSTSTSSTTSTTTTSTTTVLPQLTVINYATSTGMAVLAVNYDNYPPNNVQPVFGVSPTLAGESNTTGIQPSFVPGTFYISVDGDQFGSMSITGSNGINQCYDYTGISQYAFSGVQVDLSNPVTIIVYDVDITCAGTTTTTTSTSTSTSTTSTSTSTTTTSTTSTTTTSTTTFFVPGEDITSFGDSITVGQNATASNGYIQQFATHYSQTLDNQAAGGRGSWRMATNSFTNLTTNTTYVTTMTGLNDFRRSGTDARTTQKLRGCHISVLAQQWASQFVNGAHVDVIWDDTYNSYAAEQVGGKYGTVFPSVPNTTNAGFVGPASTATASWTFSGDNVVIGFIGNSGDAETFGTANIYIDSILQTSLNTNALYDNISDGIYDNRRGPYAIAFLGLASGSHTIEVQSQADGYMIIDYFATLLSPGSCKPVIFAEIPHLNTAGYATSPANANDSILDAASSVIESIVNQFSAEGYPIVYFPTNTFYDVNTGISGDDIHPSDIGHAQIYNGLLIYT